MTTLIGNSRAKSLTIKRQISQDLYADLVGRKWSAVNNCYAIARLIRFDLGLSTPEAQITDISNTSCNVADICVNIDKWVECDYMRHGSLLIMGRVRLFSHVGVVVDGKIYHMDRCGLSIESLSDIKKRYKKTGFYEQSCNI